MNRTPLTSVLIPAYNHERYVGDCVRSVMAQDWARMELLIVDDGSADGTWREIQKLAEEARKSGKFERVEIATVESAQGIYDRYGVDFSGLMRLSFEAASSGNVTNDVVKYKRVKRKLRRCRLLAFFFLALFVIESVMVFFALVV